MSGLVIAIIPIILIILVISWVIQRGVKRAVKYIGWNRRLNKWVIGAYVAILLLSVVVYEVLHVEGEETITTKEFKKLETENDIFEQAFLRKEVSNLNSSFLVEEWTKELEGEEVNIISPGSDHPTVKVYVEWTDSKEQLVEGKVYRTNLVMYGMNLKGIIPVSKMEWEGDQLVIKNSANQEITFYKFSDKLASLSFNDHILESEFGQLRGETYVHLKVPKHINVVDELGFQLY